MADRTFAHVVGSLVMDGIDTPDYVRDLVLMARGRGASVESAAADVAKAYQDFARAMAIPLRQLEAAAREDDDAGQAFEMVDMVRGELAEMVS